MKNKIKNNVFSYVITCISTEEVSGHEGFPTTIFWWKEHVSVTFPHWLSPPLALAIPFPIKPTIWRDLSLLPTEHDFQPHIPGPCLPQVSTSVFSTVQDPKHPLPHLLGPGSIYQRVDHGRHQEIEIVNDNL